MNLIQKKGTQAWMSGDLFTLGMGQVVIARFKANGAAEVGVFLLDVFCLGVKNAFFEKLDETESEGRLDQFFEASNKLSVTPAYARKLVEASAAYAASLGFGPCADYKQACKVFGGISASDCKEVFEFGKDGKPFFIQGPHDSPARVSQVVRLLSAKCGPDNFYFSNGFADDDGTANLELGHRHDDDCGCGHRH